MAAACRSKILSEVRDERLPSLDVRDYSDSVFLGEVKSESDSRWLVKLKVNDEKIEFKMDTGADETCIPYDVLSKLKNKLPKLNKSKKKLHACDGKKLDLCEKFTAASKRIIKSQFKIFMSSKI